MTLDRWQDKSHALGSARASSVETAPEVRRRARVFTAGNAKGVEDCALLLDILGLSPVGGEWT